MPQFDFSTFSSQIFWVLLSFWGIYYLSKTLFLPKILSIHEERSKIIENNLLAASKSIQENTALQEQYKSELQKAQMEASAILAEHLRNFQIKSHEQNASLDKEIDALIHEGEKEILELKNKFSESLNSMVLEQAQFILKKVANKEFDLSTLKATLETLQKNK